RTAPSTNLLPCPTVRGETPFLGPLLVRPVFGRSSQDTSIRSGGKGTIWARRSGPVHPIDDTRGCDKQRYTNFRAAIKKIQMHLERSPVQESA
ncbi:MAG: hypothetical protein KDA49_03880, partial [Rhodospirillaceae bacterium]|nr:hypothetical protein [Rhodospirillaceae bacterium]